MSQGVIGTLILDIRAFNTDIFHDEGKRPVVNNAFISSSSTSEMVQKTSFIIASGLLSSPQL